MSIQKEVYSERILRMSEGHPEFLRILKEIEDLHRKKSADYGVADDIFLNIRQSSDWGVKPWVGAMVRAGDKVVRLKAAASGSKLKNEGVEDSLIDLAAYAMIALALYREGKSNDTD
jgi:hypothetical protein